jgi:uncharacterized protein (DUF952 family)
MTTLIYKIATRAEWDAAQAAARYEGSPDDARDGFIHLSAREQLAGTLAKHFAGLTDLVLIAVDGDRLGEALKWGPSRGGELFPHHYGPMSLDAVIGVADLPVDSGGRHDVTEALHRLDACGALGPDQGSLKDGSPDEGDHDQGTLDQGCLEEGPIKTQQGPGR